VKLKLYYAMNYHAGYRLNARNSRRFGDVIPFTTIFTTTLTITLTVMFHRAFFRLRLFSLRVLVLQVASILVCSLSSSVCFAGEPPESATDAVSEVRAVLEAQVRAWNAGNIEDFMAGYWRSDSLRFASGANVKRGWQITLDRYKKNYPNRAAMGTLTFSNLEITPLAADAVLVFGAWELQREQDERGGKDRQGGQGRATPKPASQKTSKATTTVTTTKATPSNTRPHGLFTLTFRKTADGWKIVHDHTSSGE
jgi:hypothetical protein